MPIPLEDQLGDVLGKAQRGLRLNASQLAEKSGVGLDNVESFVAGELLDNANSAAKIARALDLYAPALLELGRGEWHPGDVALPTTVAAYNQPFGGDMTVNFYLAWDQDGGRAAAFDTGGDCGPLLQTLRDKKLKLDAIFLTHTHSDHVADLDRLTAETDAPVYVSEREKIDGATPVRDGESFTVGGLRVTARLTPGHSPGGTTYVVEGLSPTLAIVGDALFAASMGGVSPENYTNAIKANREKIFTLPDDAVLLPGHGPATTVGKEKRHNPFYAADV